MKNLLFAMIAAAILVPSAVRPAAAQEATPSHVYQVVDNINAELALLHDANFSSATEDASVPELTPRRPRHVIQKGREVFLKVQALRALNGLPEKPLPAMPVREIKPTDVKALVDDILADIQSLRPVFGIREGSPSVELKADKTPTDVYRNLSFASAQIDALGIPRVVPNDVYRLALSIISDLESVRKAKGIADPVTLDTDGKGKTPKDAYQAGIAVLESLGGITQLPGMEIPNGVVMPNLRTGGIKPDHVMDVLNAVLAEVSAIKVVTGVQDPTVIAAPPAGKTPSDVYNALTTTLRMLEPLQTAS